MSIKRDDIDNRKVDFSDIPSGVVCRRCTLAKSFATSS